MDKYKELIEQIRRCATGKSCQGCRREKDALCMVNFMAEAADAIEELLKASEKPTGLLPVGTDLDDIVDLGEYFFSINSNMEEKVNDSISRQAAIDAINQICPIDTEYDCTLLDRVDVRCVLTDLPSTQQEIIRCEDCLAHGVCRFEQALGLDGYCSKAERRQKNE